MNSRNSNDFHIRATCPDNDNRLVSSRVIFGCIVSLKKEVCRLEETILC